MSKHAISFDPDQGLTRQSFKEECDINNIVATYMRTGMVNHLPRVEPQYGDAPDLDFNEAAGIRARVRQMHEEEGYEPPDLETLEIEKAPEAQTEAPEASEEVPTDSP